MPYRPTWREVDEWTELPDTGSGKLTNIGALRFSLGTAIGQHRSMLGDTQWESQNAGETPVNNSGLGMTFGDYPAL